MSLPLRKTRLNRRTGLQPRRPKYNSVATTLTIDGERHTYHSRYESGYAKMLHGLKAAGKLEYVKEQVRYKMAVGGRHICTHLPDFEVGVIRPGGIVQTKVVEAKGYKTDVYRLKRKLFEALYPEIEYLENPTEEEVLK